MKWQASRRIWGVRWRIALERRDPTDPHPNVQPQHFWAATRFEVGTPIWEPRIQRIPDFGDGIGFQRSREILPIYTDLTYASCNVSSNFSNTDEKILNILRDGDKKAVSSLSTLGAKRTKAILDFRTFNGPLLKVRILVICLADQLKVAENIILL